VTVRPLIPRRKLFDNPTFFGAKLSPDGQLLSWLAPADGVLNVWVSPADRIAAGQPVTRTKGRPVNGNLVAAPDYRFGQSGFLAMQQVSAAHPCSLRLGSGDHR
jgi:hypothetical protein